MLFELFKALLIGICASAPLGPVAVYIFQRTLCYGPKSGFVSGFGSATIDTVYAVISLLALSAIRDFISSQEMWIMIIGGIVICCVGVRVASKNTVRQIAVSDTGDSHIGGVFKAAGCALANPGALALMLTLISVFGMGHRGGAMIFADAVFVFAGEMLYWLFFTWLVNRVGENIHPNSVKIVGRIAGVVIVGLGAVLIVRGLIKL